MLRCKIVARRPPVLTQLSARCASNCASLPRRTSDGCKRCGQPPFGLLPVKYKKPLFEFNRENQNEKGHALRDLFRFELVGQNCNSVKSRILCLRFINTEIIPLNTVLVNRFLKSFCKIIETMSYYFLYLMYKYRLKRGKPILSLSFYATSIFRNSSSA